MDLRDSPWGMRRVNKDGGLSTTNNRQSGTMASRFNNLVDHMKYYIKVKEQGSGECTLLETKKRHTMCACPCK